MHGSLRGKTEASDYRTAHGPAIPLVPHAEPSPEYRQRRHTPILLAALALVYVVIYGWLLVRSDFVPYVTDNNESFSAFAHATNMFDFGIANSAGLGDESFSPHAAAHPYAYTHGGTFPRLFAYLLYTFGARSIQSQIAITTFTVGSASLLLVFLYFSRVAGARFAIIACLVLETDYLLFAQWQLDIFRVWHTLFLFGGLLCVHGVLAGRRRRLWFVAAFVNHLGLVYFDFTFAAFVAIMCGLYAAVLLRRQPRLMLQVWLAEAAGAAVSAAMLIVQDVLYMGLPAFIEDAVQTYGARNAPIADTDAGGQLVRRLTDFYAAHHVVFWQQLGSGEALRDPITLARSTFGGVFQPATPLFSLIVLVIVGGVALGAVSRPRQSLRRARPRIAAIALLAAGAIAVACVVNDAAVLGQPPDALNVRTLLPTALIVTVVALGWLRFGNRSGSIAVLPGVALLLGAAIVTRLQFNLYRPDLAGLVVLGGWAPLWLAQAVVLLAMAFGLSLTINGSTRLLGPHARLVPGVLRYLACGTLAYVIAYVVLPGYITTVYLGRWAPLPVFVWDVAIALATSAVLSAGLHFVGRESRRYAFVVGAPVLALFGFIVAYWTGVQFSLSQLLPPTGINYFAVLSEPPFHGATFAVDAYAAPIRVATDEWAYFDRQLGTGRVDVTDAGYAVARDSGYLWFADRDSNPDYLKPRYFLCTRPPSLDEVARRLVDPAAPVSTCSDSPLVQLARRSNDQFPRDRVVAADGSGRDRWAIVQLDWDYPPYLARLPGSAGETYVEVSLDRIPDGRVALVPRFIVRHQEGSPTRTLLRLYGAGADNTCVLTETEDPSALVLPPNFSGRIRVAVTPRTGTATGREYVSDPIELGQSATGACNGAEPAL